ncbi:hypothetical protein CFC21_059460 [Triticum aestivum]|uniref:Uncharacterized protein n=3 Tax=Triticum TaxID=4564 RepID=A0A9R1KEP1_WHEAT|nr:uncharacterized protein LOC123089548 [Triticum aestivum]KAF7051191.1 hypothetical protein CFC21_059460 [Triticum aestivum]
MAIASKLESLMKRLWSYLPSSLSSSRSDPPQQIPDPTGDPPAAKAGDTPALLQEPPPALQDPLPENHSPNGEIYGNQMLTSSKSYPSHKIHDPPRKLMASVRSRLVQLLPPQLGKGSDCGAVLPSLATGATLEQLIYEPGHPSQRRKSLQKSHSL